MTVNFGLNFFTNCRQEFSSDKLIPQTDWRHKDLQNRTTDTNKAIAAVNARGFKYLIVKYSQLTKRFYLLQNT